MTVFVCVRNFLIVTLLAFLVACGHQGVRSPNDIEVIDIGEPREQELLLPEGSNPSATSSAVDQLLGEAKEATMVKSYEKAAALIERAIRLEPNDGRIYFSLAQVYSYMSRTAESVSFLNKARGLSVNDAALTKLIDDFVLRHSNN